MDGPGDMTQAKADAAAMGIFLDVPEPEPYELWPECAESLDVFLAMRTQWETSDYSGAAKGLRYESLAATMDMMGVEDRKQVFADVRDCEAEALRCQMNKA